MAVYFAKIVDDNMKKENDNKYSQVENLFGVHLMKRQEDKIDYETIELIDRLFNENEKLMKRLKNK
ncbi:hypothetical protein G5T19_01875 [Lactobacillus reuteri]|nr:hypothetical protein [Limosilactobacillus reuteri]